MGIRQKWPGGYSYVKLDGQRVFVIEREVRGKRFHVSTHAHNLRAAMAQLERFEADPNGYNPLGDSSEEPLLLSTELILKHRNWSVEVKGNTRHHAKEVAARLAEWMVALGPKDLRALTMRDDIKPTLEKWKTSRRHRIIALKAFYAWLRKEEHLLASANDPTLDLPVPQAVPEKTKRRKAVEPARIKAAWRELEGSYRDMLEVLAATGMHVSELERFIRKPDSQLVKGKQPKAVLVTRHKTGILTRIPLNDTSHVAAAERLKERGTVPRWFRRHLRDACERAGVEPFNPGVLRHSVATYAVQKGATPDAVAQFLHHRDKRTTERFYVDVAAPTNQVPTVKMR